MEDQKYRLLFKGDIVPGFELDRVKRNLANMYQVDLPKIETLFSGKVFVVQENVTLDNAQKFMFDLEYAGAVCEIEKMPAPAATPQPAPPPPQKQQTAKPEVKPEIKQETKPVIEPEPPKNQPVSEPEPQPDIKPDIKPDIQPDFEPELHSQFEPDIHPEFQPETEATQIPPENKPGFQSEFERELQSVSQTAPESLDDDSNFAPEIPAVTQLDYEASKSSMNLDLTLPPDEPEMQTELISTPPKETIEEPELPIIDEKPAAPVTEPSPSQLVSSKPQPSFRTPDKGEPKFSYRKAPNKNSLPMPLILGGAVLLVVVVFILFKLFSGKTEVPTQTPTPTRTVHEQAAPREQEQNNEELDIQSDTMEVNSDNNGYFAVSLPNGYISNDKSLGKQSELHFNYVNKAYIVITGFQLEQKITPQTALMQKTLDIQQGNDPMFKDYKIVKQNQSDILGLTGYEISLNLGSRLGYIYGIFSARDTFVSVSIVAANSKNMEFLKKTIQENLSVY